MEETERELSVWMPEQLNNRYMYTILSPLEEKNAAGKQLHMYQSVFENTE